MAKRILLCDDESHILRALEIKLKGAGYEVQLATDGEEGWESIRASRPDLLITDCQMPRLDGLGLAERIQQTPEFAEMPVIMLSAKGFETVYRERAHACGIREIVPKPFSPREVLRLVQQTLETCGANVEVTA